MHELRALKEGGHSRNGVFFEIVNKKKTLSELLTVVLASKVHPIPLKFLSKESQNSTLRAAILNCT